MLPMELNSLASWITPLRAPNSMEKYPLESVYPSLCAEPLHTVSITAGSGGAVPSSIVTRPLTKIGCGMLGDGVVEGWSGWWTRVVVVRPDWVVVVPGVVPVDVPVPVLGGAVVPPLAWPMTDVGINKPTATGRSDCPHPNLRGHTNLP